MKAASLLSQRLPLVGVLIAAVTGVLGATWYGDAQFFWIGLTGLALLLLSLHRKGGWAFAFTLASFACLQYWAWNDAPARKLAQWFETHPKEFEVQGVVVSESKLSPSGTSTLLVRVEKMTDSLDMATSIILPVEIRVRWSGESPCYGDLVSFRGVPEDPPSPRNPGGFDYPLWLQRHGIYTQFIIDPSDSGKILSHGHGNPIMAWALASRHRMETILGTDLEGAPMELSAIKGITLGITENSPEGFTEDFRFTGTMHLFAVSGLHVGMLAVMIWFVLKAFRIPRLWAVALIIPLLFFYVTVTGLKSGSIRSASMISILLLGAILYRRAPSINTLAAAALIQLAIDPNAFFSAGWQFSYSVVFAILVVAPMLETPIAALYAPDPFIPKSLLTAWENWRFSIWKHLAALMAVSTAAWIGSLIPTIAYFHLVSLSAIWANLLTVPLAFAVLAHGALALLTGCFSLWVAGAFNNANWLVTKMLLIVVQTSALMPGGHWFVGSPAKPHPVITLLDLGGGACAVVQSGAHFALVNVGRKRDAVRDILPYLETRGANSIENILITKPDAAHLGGVPQVAKEFPVGALQILSENTRSAVAKVVMRSFATKVVKLQQGAPFALLPEVSGEVMFQNNATSVLLLHSGKIRILFLSKLTPQSSQQLLAELPREVLHAEVLVLPLGGSEILSTLSVIHQVRPKVLVSPVDPLNRNGVPSPEWNQLLAREGVRLMRQDETGAVTIDCDPGQLAVTAFLGKTTSLPLAP